MNSNTATVVESSITAAEPLSKNRNGLVKLSAQQKREHEDITAWLQEQDDAEVEFLMAEITAKNNRSYRRSMSY